jgi:putative heme-binding domain-containing protein
LEALGAHKPFVAPSMPKPVGPGRDRTTDDVVTLAKLGLHARDFNNGKKTFAAARCVMCHRFGGDGQSTGPDLTQLAGRFSVNALAESIVEPSKVIADDYRSHSIMANGKTYTGRIVAEIGGKVTMITDPEDATKTVEIPRDEIESESVSPISLMPTGLLKPLNDNEVLDLFAYLLSRGNPQDPMFDARQAAANPSSAAGK